MRKRKLLIALLLVITIAALPSCMGASSMTPIEGATVGGAAGAAVGGLIGYALGNPGLGAAIGGTVGAISGAAQGAENQRRLQEIHREKLGNKLDAGWKGPAGEITGTLQVENSRLYYCLGNDYLVWDPAGECWYTEN